MGSIRDKDHAFASQLVDRQRTFRREYLDFDRGIRIGHLEVEERLTQILKRQLTERYGVRMICDRWGRGMYWQLGAHGSNKFLRLYRRRPVIRDTTSGSYMSKDLFEAPPSEIYVSFVF
jgi:hypothetical protein